MKHRSLQSLGTALLAALLGACAAAPREIEQPGIAWNVEFEYPLRFQRMVDEQMLIVGTSRHLHALDPRSGRQLWRARNVSARSEDIIAVPELPYLLVMDAGGGSFDDGDTHILAIDRFDGEMFWESPRIAGKVQQAVIDPDSGRLYAVAVGAPHGDDTGLLADILPGKGIGSGLLREPQLIAMELRTGRILWTRAFGDRVPLRPVGGRVLDDNGDWQPERSFDLGLYREPFVAGDRICLSYTGISCFSAATGAPAWQREFAVNEGKAALSYTSAFTDDRTVYMSGGGRLQALDAASGALRWQSRRADAIPQMVEMPDTLYLQLGGRFFDTGSETWEWNGEFGAMAVDRHTGETRWTFDGADDAVSNLLVFSGRVWLADEDALIVLRDADGARVAEVEHGFDAPPVIAALNDRGQIVLANESEACAIDPLSLEMLWRVRYEPPGPGGWERFSTGLLGFSGDVLRFTSTVVAYTSGLVPTAPGIQLASGSINLKLISSKRLVGKFTGRSGRRLSYRADGSGESRTVARLSGAYLYFVTQAEDSRLPAIAMVELDTGRTGRLFALPYAEPDLLIDDTTGQLFQASGARLTAVRLRSNSDLPLPAP